jgi:GT2 family glycosyltransferase
VDLILRRFLPLKALKNLINRRYELHDLPQTSLVDVPSISGCFLMVRTKLFERIGVFDSRYFMYLEDVDLVRRIGSVARVSYDPRISITHTYAKGSYYNKKLLRYHITSAINYFNKWGWWVDVDRVKRNSAILSHIDRLKK